ncbi:MAG: hypothetical protein ACTSRU_13550 [Candidatus Hodarchaeales archaeon]
MEIDLSNDNLVMVQLRNVYIEAEVLFELRKEFFFGHEDFILEANIDPSLQWIKDFLFGCENHTALTIRYQNMYFAWPKYPHARSLRKPIGTPYKQRIERSFGHLQYVVDRYYWILKELFDNLILDDGDWYFKIERAIDLICSAYQDPMNDQFNQREDCTILRPDKYILREIRSEMVQWKKEWKEKQQ